VLFLCCLSVHICIKWCQYWDCGLAHRRATTKDQEGDGVVWQCVEATLQQRSSKFLSQWVNYCALYIIIIIIGRYCSYSEYRGVSVLRNGPEKITQSLMCRHFATVCSTFSITQFSPDCSEINWYHEECANLNIILNILCLVASTLNYLKSINTGTFLRLLWLKKSLHKRYRINWEHIHPKD